MTPYGLLNGLGCEKQTCIVVPELIPSTGTWVKPNPTYASKYEYIFVIFKTVQSVKS